MANLEHITFSLITFQLIFVNLHLVKTSDISKMMVNYTLNSNKDGIIKVGCVDSWMNQNTTFITPANAAKYDEDHTHITCAQKCLEKSDDLQLSFVKGAQCQCAPISGFASYFQATDTCNIRCPVRGRQDNGDLPEYPCGGNRRYSVYCTSRPDSEDCHNFKQSVNPDDEVKASPNSRTTLGSIPVLEDLCAYCDATIHSQCMGRTGLSASFDYFPTNSPEDCVNFCHTNVEYLRRTGAGERDTRLRTAFSILMWWVEPGSLVPMPMCYCAEYSGQREWFIPSTTACATPCPGDPSKICGRKQQTGMEGIIYATVYCNEDDPPNGRCHAQAPTTTTTSTTTTTTTTTTQPPETFPTSESVTTEVTSATETTEHHSTTEYHYGSPSTSTVVPTSVSTAETEETSSSGPIPSSSPATPITLCDLVCDTTDRFGYHWKVCNGTEGRVPCRKLKKDGNNGTAIWKCSKEGHFETFQPNVRNCKSRWLEKKHLDVEDVKDIESASEFIGDLSEACGLNPNLTTSNKTYFGHEILNMTKLVNEALCKVREICTKNNVPNWSHEFPSLVESGLSLDACLIQYHEPWKDLTLPSKSSVSTSLIENMEEKLFQLTTTYITEHDHEEKMGSRWNFTPTVDSPGNENHLPFIIMAEIFTDLEGNSGTYQFPPIEAGSNPSSYIKLPQGWRKLLKAPDAELAAMSIESELVGYIMPGQYQFGEKPSDELDPHSDMTGSNNVKILNGRLISVTFGTSSSTNGSISSDRFHMNLPGVEVTFKHNVDAWGDKIIELQRKLHSGEKPAAVRGSAQCAFWDVKTNIWSTNGCQLARTTRSETLCICNHLTSFAILMDLHKYVGKNYGLELLTLILCPMSAIALILTIILLIPIKSGPQRMRATINKNLAFCLLIGNTLVLLVLDRNYFHMGENVCIGAGMVTHYAFLCAFMWMLIEGIHLYRMVECVFNLGRSYTHHFVLFAYGFPAIIVGVTGTAGFLLGGRPYGSDIYCWLEGDYVWTFMAPVAVITLVNLIILFIALKTGYRLQNQNHSRRLSPAGLVLMEKIGSYKTWLNGCFSLTVTLGLTWAFGFSAGLMTGSNGLISSYIFTILNASQGLFLLYFTCRVFPESSKSFTARFPSWITSNGGRGSSSSIEQFVDGKKPIKN